MMMTVMMATTIMMTLKFSIPPWPICRAQAVAKYLHDLDHGYGMMSTGKTLTMMMVKLKIE